VRLSPVPELQPVTVEVFRRVERELHNEDYSKGWTAKGPLYAKVKNVRIGVGAGVPRRRCDPQIADVDLSKRPEDADPFV